VSTLQLGATYALDSWEFTSDPIDLVYTRDEAAAKLKIGLDLLIALIKAGKIREFAPSPRVRLIPGSELIAYIQNELNALAAEAPEAS
jgi:hypothetical protein